MNRPTPIYLDNAATTPVDPRVIEAMRPYLEDQFGNPSSRHRLGVRAAEALDTAREHLSRATGADTRRIHFTSGGTEANNLAVLGLARAAKARGAHVVAGPTEHSSVRDAALSLRDEGFEVDLMRLDSIGGLDLEHARSLLREDTVLVAQMVASNEFGTVYPIRELSRIVRAASPNALIHADGVQALGKLDVDLRELGCDSLSVSAHKIHAPKGTGALILADDLPIRPLCFGGAQEGKVRPGDAESQRGSSVSVRPSASARQDRVEAGARMHELRSLARRGAPGASGSARSRTRRSDVRVSADRPVGPHAGGPRRGSSPSPRRCRASWRAPAPPATRARRP